MNFCYFWGTKIRTHFSWQLQGENVIQKENDLVTKKDGEKMKVKNETIRWQKKRWGENEIQKRNDPVAEKKRWGENETQKRNDLVAKKKVGRK